MRILIFGDSITQGFFDSRGGWANRLANSYHEKKLKDPKVEWPTVFNLGVVGDFVQNVLDRVKNETKARRFMDEKVIIVIAVGINDSMLIDNRAVSDIYSFQEKYEKLIDTVTKLSDKYLFLGLSAVDERLTGSNTGGEQYLNNRINLFEDCIKQSCERKSVPFAPVHDMFIGQLDSNHSLLADGLHPDEAGHSLLYEIIAPEIDAVVRSKNSQ